MFIQQPNKKKKKQSYFIFSFIYIIYFNVPPPEQRPIGSVFFNIVNDESCSLSLFCVSPMVGNDVRTTDHLQYRFSFLPSFLPFAEKFNRERERENTTQQPPPPHTSTKLSHYIPLLKLFCVYLSIKCDGQKHPMIPHNIYRIFLPRMRMTHVWDNNLIV